MDFTKLLAELTPDALAALFTLTALEIILGIDNIVFIAILAGRLPAEQRERVRLLGLGLAMGMRILFLLSISWIMGMQAALFTLPWFGEQLPITGKSLVLIFGGLFLVYKATAEIHEKMEHESDPDLPATGCRKRSGDDHAAAAAEMSAASVAAQTKPAKPRKPLTFGRALVQILLLDLVFSIDSVVTAVGMAQKQWVMIGAVVVSVLIMMAFSGVIVRTIDRRPTIKMLALSFLLLIGVTLIAEGFGAHVSKGYIYFSMGFSLFVEILNLRSGGRKSA